MRTSTPSHENDAAAEPFSLPLRVGATVALRVGASALALRVFELDGAGGQRPELALVGDRRGIELGALRVVATHFRTEGAPAPLNARSDTHVRFGALLLAGDSNTTKELAALAARAAAAPVESRLDVDRDGGGTTWAVSVSVQGTPTLGVRRNMTCSEVGGVRNQTVNTQWNCLLSRTINGTEVVPGPLRVNGVRYTTL